MIENKTKFLNTILKKTDHMRRTESIMSSSICEERGSELFSGFLYQDQVTHSKYELSQLRNSRRLKTEVDETNKNGKQIELKNLSGELKILQLIKENRNRDLALNYKIKGDEREVKVQCHSPSPDKVQLQKTKQKMRKEVSSLNHQFLREYLYHQQPFNEAVAEINRQSDSGLMDENKVFELKNRILKSIEGRKQDSCENFSQAFSKGKHQSKRMSLKQFEEIKIDNEFKGILEQGRREIYTKVKMEGEFNLYRKWLRKCR